MSPTTNRTLSMRRQTSLRKSTNAQQVLEEQARRREEKEAEKNKEKNLQLDIKNYQRKTMLNGIDQQEMLDENFELVKQSQAQGVNPIIVSNFKGKEILDNLRELKVEYDRDYFNR